MITKKAVSQIVNRSFEEAVLVFGGLVAIHQPGNTFVEQFIRELSVIRDHALSQVAVAVEESSSRRSNAMNLMPHPAIERFLDEARNESREDA